MELVNDDLGVAYPIRGEIPRLVPADGRVLTADADAGAPSASGSGGAAAGGGARGAAADAQR